MEFGRYLRVLRRRWWAIALGTLAGFGAALAFLAVTPPTSTASALVDINVVSSEPFNPSRPRADLLNVTTEVQTARSPTVIRSVNEQLDRDVAEIRENLTVTVLPDSTVMRISYAARSEEAATTGADLIAAAYLQHRAAVADDRIGQLVAALDQRRDTLRERLVSATRRANRAQGAALAEAQNDQALLRSELDLLLQQVNTLTGIDTSGGTVLAAASDNTVTTSPNRLLVQTTGALGGLVLGLVGAFLIHGIDRRVRDRDDVHDARAGSVLVTIGGHQAAVPAHGKSADAIRTLREHLLAVLPAEHSILAVADVSRRAAPSDVALNLAVAMAEAGVRTELVLAEYPDWILERIEEPLQLTSKGTAAPRVRRWASAAYDELVVDLPEPAEGRLDPSASFVTELLRNGGTAEQGLTIIALPPRASRSLVLASGRLGHSVLLVAQRRATSKKDLADVADELATVDAVVHGTVLQGGRRSWPDAEQPVLGTDLPDPRPAEA